MGWKGFIYLPNRRQVFFKEMENALYTDRKLTNKFKK